MKKKEKSMMEVTKDYEAFIKKHKLKPKGKEEFNKALQKAVKKKLLDSK